MPSANLARSVQLVRKLLLQEQLAQVDSPLVDLDDLRADAGIADVPDFDLALEPPCRKQLAPEIQHLTNCKIPGAHEQEAAPAHVMDQAREPIDLRF